MKLTSFALAGVLSIALAEPAMAHNHKGMRKDKAKAEKSMKASDMRDADDRLDRMEERREERLERMEDRLERDEDRFEDRMDREADRYEDRLERMEERAERREDRMDEWEDRYEDREDYEGRDNRMRRDDNMIRRDERILRDGRLTDRALPSQAIQNSQRVQTIACPTGTTAQPNGTCLVTGDFRFDD